MRRLTTIVAAVIAAVVALSVLSGRMSTGLGHAAQADPAPASTSAKPTSGVKADSAAYAQVGAASPTVSAPGAGVDGVRITSGSTAVVYRLAADVAMVSSGELTLYTPAVSLVSTSGAGRQSTSQFVQRWTSDPFAGTLSAVLLGTDGVRHAITLAAPATASGRLTFHVTASTSVPSDLATETGLSNTGAVSGVSGTLHTVNLFIAMNAGRIVNGCQLAPNTNCDGRNLLQTVLTGVDLTGASLRSANLWQAVLHGANLAGADITGARAFRADLSSVSGANLAATGIDLTQASLISAQLPGATLDRAKVNRADLTDVVLSGASLRNLAAANVYARNANFARANLAGASFATADLRGADFRGANLANVNLDRANLAGADFTGANLTGAVLNRATVKHAVFTHAIFGHTKCVDGLVRNTCH
jgi:uncharacterized protein YjbI with pentapeptide repeats